MRHEIVEQLNAVRLLVVIIGAVDHMAVPQRVVGHDHAAGVHERQNVFIGLEICAFVAIEERHVEGHAELWCQQVSVADGERYLVGIGRVFDPWTGEIFHLVVYLEGVEHGAVFQSLGHAQRTVAAERAYLQNVFGTHHLHEHLQESSLKVSARHSAVYGVYVCRAIQAVEIVALGVGVGEDVGVEGEGSTTGSPSTGSPRSPTPSPLIAAHPSPYGGE